MDKEGTRITCKVTDFGFAVKKKENEQVSLPLGTAPYMAPEIILAKSYGQAVDIWAIGVMAYELLFDEWPFRGVDPNQVHNEIRHKLKKEDTIFTGRTLTDEAKHFKQV